MALTSAFTSWRGKRMRKVPTEIGRIGSRLEGCKDSRFEVWHRLIRLDRFASLNLTTQEDPKGSNPMTLSLPTVSKSGNETNSWQITSAVSATLERFGEHPPIGLTSTIKLQCLPVHENTGGVVDVSLSAAIFNPHASTKIVFRTPEHASHHDEWLVTRPHPTFFLTPSNHWHANSSENALYLCSWTCSKDLLWSYDQEKNSHTWHEQHGFMANHDQKQGSGPLHLWVKSPRRRALPVPSPGPPRGPPAPANPNGSVGWYLENYGQTRGKPWETDMRMLISMKS